MDRMMNNGFEANKGRLPMPITGGYRVVSHFGQYHVAGLKGVTLDNKGINIMGGVVRTVEDMILNKRYRAIYDAEDAERLKRRLEQDKLEAEKERIRAERRAANPEGITCLSKRSECSL